jgi:hypothetical protein
MVDGPQEDDEPGSSRLEGVRSVLVLLLALSVAGASAAHAQERPERRRSGFLGAQVGDGPASTAPSGPTPGAFLGAQVADGRVVPGPSERRVEAARAAYLAAEVELQLAAASVEAEEHVRQAVLAGCLEGEEVPRGDGPIEGFFHDATPALRQGSCHRVESALEVAAERAPAVAPPLPEHLEEAFDILGPEEYASDMGSWFTRRLLGGVGSPREWLSSSLSDALTIGLVSGQFLTDASMGHDGHLRSDFVARAVLTDGLAHGIAQGIAWLGRRDGEEEDLLDCDASDPRGCRPSVRTSGRATLAFTSASLMCAHNRMLALGDFGRCARGMAVAATVGAMRAFSEEHRFTDVLVSASVGLATGYLVPLATLYAGGESFGAEDEGGSTGLRAVLSPSFSTRGLGIQAQGTF